MDPDLVRSIIGQESSGKRTATSPKGARGLMQLMPATAARYGVKDVNNPEENIRGGTDYLKFLSDKFKGDPDLVLAGYNAGEGAVEKHGNKIPPYAETQAYVPAVKARYQKLTGRQLTPNGDALGSFLTTGTTAPSSDTSALDSLLTGNGNGQTVPLETQPTVPEPALPALTPRQQAQATMGVKVLTPANQAAITRPRTVEQAHALGQPATDPTLQARAQEFEKAHSGRSPYEQRLAEIEANRAPTEADVTPEMRTPEYWQQQLIERKGREIDQAYAASLDPKFRTDLANYDRASALHQAQVRQNAARRAQAQAVMRQRAQATVKPATGNLDIKDEGDGRWSLNDPDGRRRYFNNYKEMSDALGSRGVKLATPSKQETEEPLYRAQQNQKAIQEELANAESAMPLRERLLARDIPREVVDHLAPAQPMKFTPEQKTALGRLGFDDHDQQLIAQGRSPKPTIPRAPAKRADTQADEATLRSQINAQVRHEREAQLNSGVISNEEIDAANSDQSGRKGYFTSEAIEAETDRRFKEAKDDMARFEKEGFDRGLYQETLKSMQTDPDWFSPLHRSYIDTVSKVGGIVQGLSRFAVRTQIGTTPAYDYMAKKTNALHLALNTIESEEPLSKKQQAAKTALDITGDILTIMSIPGGPVTKFGILNAAAAAGRGLPWFDVGSAGGKGSLLGAVFEVAPVVESLGASGVAKTFGEHVLDTVKSGAVVGAGTLGVEKGWGASDQQAAQSALTNVILHGITKIAPEAMNRSLTKGAEVAARSPITPDVLRTRIAERGGVGQYVLVEHGPPTAEEGENDAVAKRDTVPTGRALSVYGDPSLQQEGVQSGGIRAVEISGDAAAAREQRGVQRINVTPEEYQRILDYGKNPAQAPQIAPTPPAQPQITDAASPRSQGPASPLDTSAIDAAQAAREAQEKAATRTPAVITSPEVTKARALDALDRANQAGDGPAVKELIKQAHDKGADSEEIDAVLRKLSGARMITPVLEDLHRANQAVDTEQVKALTKEAESAGATPEQIARATGGVVAPTAEGTRLTERAETVERQLDTLVAGKGSRTAVILSPGQQEPASLQQRIENDGLDVRYPDTAPEGTLAIYDPNRVTGEEIDKAFAENTTHKLIGKPNAETSKATIAAATYDKSGLELDAGYLEPGNEKAYMDEMKAQHGPDVTFSIGGKPVEDKVLADRIAGGAQQPSAAQVGAVEKPQVAKASQPAKPVRVGLGSENQGDTVVIRDSESKGGATVAGADASIAERLIEKAISQSKTTEQLAGKLSALGYSVGKDWHHQNAFVDYVQARIDSKTTQTFAEWRKPAKPKGGTIAAKGTEGIETVQPSPQHRTGVAETPVAGRAGASSLELTPEKQPWKERWGDEAENVPVSFLDRIKEYDRGGDGKLDALKKDIQENGIKEPVVIAVGKKTGTAQLSEGNRRLQAAKELGLTEIPARVIVQNETHKHDVTSNEPPKVPMSRVPVEGYFRSEAKPSDVFDEFQPSPLEVVKTETKGKPNVAQKAVAPVSTQAKGAGAVAAPTSLKPWKEARVGDTTEIDGQPHEVAGRGLREPQAKKVADAEPGRVVIPDGKRFAVVRPTGGKKSLIDEVSGLVDDKGKLTRGGDVVTSLMKGRADVEVQALHDWAEAHESPAVKRFVGGGATAELRSREKEEPAHEFSSTQVNLPPDVAKLVKAASMKIADEDLAEDGRDEHPHITLAFGVNDDEPDNVEQVLEGEGPITAKIGKVSMFPASESGKADVLKINVTSRTLHRLHKKIGKEVDVTDTHPTYKPHVTLAYVKPGRGAKYVGMETGLEGREVTFDEVAFSDKDREQTAIPLGGEEHATDQQLETQSGERKHPRVTQRPAVREDGGEVRGSDRKQASGGDRAEPGSQAEVGEPSLQQEELAKEKTDVRRPTTERGAAGVSTEEAPEEKTAEEEAQPKVACTTSPESKTQQAAVPGVGGRDLADAFDDLLEPAGKPTEPATATTPIRGVADQTSLAPPTSISEKTLSLADWSDQVKTVSSKTTVADLQSLVEQGQKIRETVKTNAVLNSTLSLLEKMLKKKGGKVADRKPEAVTEKPSKVKAEAPKVQQTAPDQSAAASTPEKPKSKIGGATVPRVKKAKLVAPAVVEQGKPYAETLRDLSDKELRAEDRKVSDAINEWAAAPTGSVLADYPDLTTAPAEPVDPLASVVADIASLYGAPAPTADEQPVAEVETPAPGFTSTDNWKGVGVNKSGDAILENDQGVRSYMVEGHRFEEPKTADGKPVTPRAKEFQTVEAVRVKKRKETERQRAEQLGQAAFDAGRPAASAQDPAFMDWLKERSDAQPDATKRPSLIPLLEAWNSGWHKANMEAPAPAVDADMLEAYARENGPITSLDVAEQHFGWNMSRAATALLQLEMENRAQQMPGREFRLTAKPAETVETPSTVEPEVAAVPEPEEVADELSLVSSTPKLKTYKDPEGRTWEARRVGAHNNFDIFMDGVEQSQGAKNQKSIEGVINLLREKMALDAEPSDLVHITTLKELEENGPSDLNLTEKPKRRSATEPRAKKEKVAEAPAKEHVADVGENLFYNRRNFTGKALQWDEVKNLNNTLKVKEVVKSKVWPRPNYEELIASGLNPLLARMVKKTYNGVANEPRKKDDASLERYISVVGKIRTNLFDWIKDLSADEEFMKAVDTAIAGEHLHLNPILEKTKYGLFFKIWPEAKGTGSTLYSIGGETAEDIRAVDAAKGRGRRRYHSLDADLAIFENRDIIGALNDLKEGWPTPQEAWQRQGWKVLNGDDAKTEIYGGSKYVGPNHDKRIEVTHIYLKIDGHIVSESTVDVAAQADPKVVEAVAKLKEMVAGKFVLARKYGRTEGAYNTEEEAKEAAREKTKRNVKEGGRDLRGMNIAQSERVGPDRRADEDISPERLMKEFGFRGINFGRESYINQAERQAYLNAAFDGLVDLAEIMGVPRTALSLEGTLGLAFGAQGRGGTVAAHFVPGVNEINLTKTAGAGTLAHEFSHGLDHYFARLAGLGSKPHPYVSEHLSEAEGTSRTVRTEKVDPNTINDADIRLEEFKNDNGGTDSKVFYKGRLVGTIGGKSTGFPGAPDTVTDPIAQRRAREVAARDIAKVIEPPVRKEVIAAFRAISNAMNKRVLSPAEAKDRLAKKIDGQRSGLKSWIDHFRRDLVPKAGGATPSFKQAQALKDFDELATRLLDGDMGSGYVTVRGKSWPQVVGQMRMLVRENGKDSGARDWGSLESWSRSLRSMLSMKGADEEHVPQETEKSTYAKESAKRDKDKGGKDYWDTEREKFARAWESFIADKLEEAGQKNTFLSDAALRAEQKHASGEYASPYPRGEERKVMNAAFQTLIDTIQSKETEKGTALYDRLGDEAESGAPEWNIEGDKIILQNRAATQLLGQAMGQQKISGMFLEHPERTMTADRLRENLDNLSRDRPDLADAAQNLSEAVGKMFKAGHRSVRIALAKRMPHETGHKAAYDASQERAVGQRHTPAGFRAITSTPEWEIIDRALNRIGYGGDSLPVRIEEAYSIAVEGRHDALGLTDAQRDNFLDAWFTSFAEAGGDISEKHFEELGDEINTIRSEAYTRRSRAVSEGVPSVEDRRQGRDEHRTGSSTTGEGESDLFARRRDAGGETEESAGVRREVAGASGAGRQTDTPDLATLADIEPRVVGTTKFKSWLSDLVDGDKQEIASAMADDSLRRDYVEDFIRDEHSLTVRPDGIIEFYRLWNDQTRKIIGDNPVLVYHHTSDAILPTVETEGLKRTESAHNAYQNSKAGVYVSTETSGPAVTGYHRSATSNLGGDEITLGIKTDLDSLEPDPDDADISSGATQFILPYVSPRDIVEITRGGKTEPFGSNSNILMGRNILDTGPPPGGWKLSDKVPRLKPGTWVSTPGGVPGTIVKGKSSDEGPVYTLSGSPKVTGREWKQDELTKFDEARYAQGKALFQSAMKLVPGGTPLEQMGGLVSALRTKFALPDATIKTMKPDLLRFMGELQTATPEVEPYEAQEPASAAIPIAGIESLATAVEQRLKEIVGTPHSMNNPELRTMADKAFGGTSAQGKYTIKDAYDALELGVNRYLQPRAKQLLEGDPKESLKTLQTLMRALPRQTDRTTDTDQLQQFSTPPTIAFVAAKALAAHRGDIVLEPSAGTGNLALWPKGVGAKVETNEISGRRKAILESQGFEPHRVDGELINDMLPTDVKPSAVLMNPPFSATGGRTTSNDTRYGARHIEQALLRLQPGGRLVALTGEGMAIGKHKFSPWWKRIMERYNVRANLGIPGDEYGKYGTTFGTNLLVIDKTGPTPGATVANKLKNVRFGDVKSLEDALNTLKPIIADRPRVTSESLGADQPDVRGSVGEPAAETGRGSELPEPEQPGTTVGETDTGEAGAGTKAVPGRERRTKPRITRPNRPLPDSGGRPEDVLLDEGVAAIPEPDFVPADLGLIYSKSTEQREEEAGGTYVGYKVAKMSGGQAHPADIVESASMAAVEPPDITYKPNLPRSIITEGKLSDLQIEAVTYAGQRFLQRLADGARAGYFLGDGTGLGKGREMAGTILDEWNQGNRRAVWLSVSKDLIESAARDLKDVGASHIQLALVNDFKPAEDITLPKGVIFSTYSSLISSAKTGNKQKRREQIEKWLGSDGVIVLDECVVEGTLIATPEGPRKIEGLRPGDVVLGFNHQTGAIEQTMIGEVFVRHTNEPMYIVGETRMTGNHPVWTENRGYVRADELNSLDLLLSIGQNTHNGNAHLRTMRAPVPGAPLVEASKAALLQQELLCEVANESTGTRSGVDRGRQREFAPVYAGNSVTPRGATEARRLSQLRSQPTLERVQSGQSNGSDARTGLSKSEWRQRADHGTSTTAPSTVGMEDGVRSENWLSTRVSEQLQDRLGRSGAENRNRSGRSITSDEEYPGIRSAQGRVSAFVGVDNPTVHQSRGLAGHFYRGGEDSPGCRVYNLTTGSGNYFANSLLTHNCHKAKNALAAGAGEPTQTGQAVIDLQANLPNARVLYASATGATDVRNMAYMTRLGLWGKGTAFPGGFMEFMGEIDRGGVGSMEMVSRDMKALGMYVSRSISFRGVDYQETIHELLPNQRAMYNAAAQAMQTILQDIGQAIEVTDASPMAKMAAMRRFWSDHQRLFRQLITAFKVPTVIREVERALKEGKSVIIDLASTGESRTKEQVTKALSEGADLEDLDFSPREVIANMVDKAFPVNVYQEVEDEATGKVTKQLVRDADGNPVVSQEALWLKNELLDKLSDVQLPENPLDQIVNHFGEKKVAEITGRKRRLIRGPDGKVGYKKRAPDGIAMTRVNVHETEQFQDGAKRIAIISPAGGTGISLHASNRAKNKQRRVHITVEFGWSADAQMQKYGRSHRSDQASPPEYNLISTDIGGEKRFSSTIARRLASLGALTKGQRDATGGGDLAKYNFETEEGKAALTATYGNIMRDKSVEGVDQPKQALRDMGVLKEREGGESISDDDMVNVPHFLNRILALDLDRQNPMFDYFAHTFDQVIDYSKQNGTFDEGVADVKGESIRLKGEPQVVHKDKTTGAKTAHYALDVDTKTTPVSFERAQVIATRKNTGFYKQKRSGNIIIARQSATHTDPATGNLQTSFTVTTPLWEHDHTIRDEELETKYEPIKSKEAAGWWEQKFESVPKIRTAEMHVIGGAILPLWQKLKTEEGARLKVIRVMTDDGQRVVGIQIPNSQVASVLRSIGIGRELKAPKEIFDAVLDQGDKITLADGLSLARSKFHGDEAIEVKGVSYYKHDQMRELGLLNERIDWTQKFFVPTDEATGVPILTKLLESYPALEESKAPIPDEEMYARELPDHSDEFKKWFGNSKVVDTDGNPLVVYHGTTESFDTFDKGFISSYSQNEYGKGFYFTPSRSAADLYTGKRWATEQSGANIVPVFLSLQNPKYVTTHDRGGAGGWHGQHDGVIVLHADYEDKNDPGDWAEIVVRDATQIKSAIGNRGTFDPENSNILMSRDLEDPEWEEIRQGGRDIGEQVEGGFPTGVKNRVTNEERANLGEEPIEIEARKIIPMFDAVKQEFNPDKSYALAAEVAEHPRNLSAEETAQMIMYKAYLKNQYADALKELRRVREDEAGEGAARIRLAVLDEQMLTYQHMGRKTGYEWGLTGRLRQEMMLADYSLAEVKARAGALMGIEKGETLPADLEQRLADLVKERDDAIEALRVYDEQKSLEAAEQRLKDLQEQERREERNRKARATQKWREEQGKEKSRYKLVTKILNRDALDNEFEQLSRDLDAMLMKDFGLNPFLEPRLLSQLKKMATNRVKAGADTVEDWILPVWERIKSKRLVLDAGATERDLRDALSGYGKTIQMSKDEIDIKLRELRALARDVSALEDIQAGGRPARSGLQRDKQTQRQRESKKRINAALREYNIEVERSERSPEELQQSALDSMKSRLRNRIEDLKTYIAGGERAPKRPGVQPDAEAQSLIAERDRLQKVLEDIEGPGNKTDDEKIALATAAVERSIADYERRIAEGDVLTTRKASDPWSRELGRLKQRQTALKAQVADARKNHETTKAEAAERSLRALKGSIDRLEQRVATGDLSTQPKAPPAVTSPEIEAAKAHRKALQSILAKMRRDAKPEKTDAEKYASRLVALHRRIDKREAELTEMLRSGKYTKRPKPMPIRDPQIDTKRAAVKRAEDQIEMKLKEIDRANRGNWQKFVGHVAGVRRAVVLSSTFVIGKLTNAALARIFLSIGEEAVGAPLPYLPIIGVVARQAPSEGRLNLTAEYKHITKAFSREMLQQAAKVLKTGKMDMDVLYGKKKEGEKPDSWYEFIGHVHGMLKTPAKIAAFERFMEKNLAWLHLHGYDVTAEPIKAIAASRAVIDANRAILQQDNVVSELFKKIMSVLEAKKYPTSEDPKKRQMQKFPTAAAILRFMFPVTRVPPNFLFEAINYTPAGLVIAAMRLGKAVYTHGLDEASYAPGGGGAGIPPRDLPPSGNPFDRGIPPDDADAIIRGIKKSVLGSPFMVLALLSALGLINFIQFGGYYRRGKKKKPEEVPFGGVRILGFDLPSWAGHIPLFEGMQMITTAVQVFQDYRDKDKDVQESATHAAFDTARGMAAEIPFYEEPSRMISAMEGPEGGAQYLGGVVRGFVMPPDIQRAARTWDPGEPTTGWQKFGEMTGFRRGQPTKRKPEGNFAQRVGQEIELGIPGLRKRVGVDDSKKRLDVKEKFVDQLRAGKPVTKDIDAAVLRGDLNPTDADAIVKEGRLTPFQYNFEKKPIEKALESFEKMPAANRAQVRQLLMEKAPSLWKLDIPDQLPAMQRFKELTGEEPRRTVPHRPYYQLLRNAEGNTLTRPRWYDLAQQDISAPPQ